MPASYDVDSPRAAAQGAGLLTALRRHPLIVVASVLIVALLGVLVTFLLPTHYTADARIVIGDPNDKTVFRTTPILNATAAAQNAAQIMRSEAVYERASVLLDHKLSASDVSDAVTVSAGATGSPLVDISATRNSAASARDVANAEGQAYLDVTRAQVVSAAKSTRAALQKPQSAMQARLATINTESQARAAAIQQKASSIVSPSDRSKYVQAALTSDPDYQSLRNQASALSTNIGMIQQTLSQTNVDASLTESGVDTLYSASKPSNPQNSNLKRNIVIAAAIGLLIGAALAWRRLDRERGIDQDQVAGMLGAPALATLKRSSEFADPTQVVDLSRGNPLSDDLRVLASTLLLNMRRRELAGCVITSAEPGVGKTVVALNLAAAASSAGHDIVLVDGDIRQATLTHAFGMDTSTGLLDVLNGSGVGTEFDEHYYAPERSLPVLPIGRRDLLEPPRAELPALRHADGTAPMAIVDSPALFTDPIALVLASGSAGLVVVVSNGTTVEDLRTLRSRAELAGAPVLGFVVNEYRPGRRAKKAQQAGGKRRRGAQSVAPTGGAPSAVPSH